MTAMKIRIEFLLSQHTDTYGGFSRVPCVGELVSLTGDDTHEVTEVWHFPNTNIGDDDAEPRAMIRVR